MALTDCDEYLKNGALACIKFHLLFELEKKKKKKCFGGAWLY